MGKRFNFYSFLLLIAVIGLNLNTEAQETKHVFFPEGDNGVMFFELDYANEFHSNVMSGGNGLSIELGLNMAAFFNKSYIIAPYCGFRTVYGTKYKSQFTKDFNRYYLEPELYDYLLQAQMNGTITESEIAELNALDKAYTNTQYIKSGMLNGGVATLYYGLVLKLPGKYFPPLKIYRLYTDSKVKLDPVFYYSGYGNEVNYLHFPRTGWGGEIILFRGKIITDSETPGNIGLGSIHLFFESMDIHNMQIAKESTDVFPSREVSLKEFVDKPFLDNYKREWRIGIKIGFSFM